ncbi:hypothetical protein [Methanobrevibacter arboriphilus]|uniref:hypothetical protein n=1 Tax=Methanobrevibacter arboriphilus TaxID=39441 RepID=UPI000A8A1BE4|nr:hypothetical protein [Methanobrevibacter arboriphilus]
MLIGKKDIKLLAKYNTPIMLVDEFITDSYDFELIEEILKEIKKTRRICSL